MPLIVVVAGTLIVVTAFGYSVVSSNKETESPVATIEASVTPPQRRDGVNMMMSEMGAMLDYQDGIYDMSVPYAIPYGYVEPMEVSLTLADGKVTDASVVFDLVNPTSQGYQQAFLEYYPREVIGESIDDISVTRVGGASLTNGAFDQAVAAIKQEANPMGNMPMMQLSSRYDENTVFSDGEYIIDDYYVVNQFLSESMRTSVTIEDGVIVDSEVSFLEPDLISVLHQNLFVEKYKDEIVGKPLHSASVARIGSVSLTTDAFNKALEKVREQAEG